MIETQAQQIPEDIYKEGLKKAKKVNAPIIDFIESLREKIGMEKEVVDDHYVDEKLSKLIQKDFAKEINGIIEEIASKESSNSDLVVELSKKIEEQVKEEFTMADILKTIDYVSKQQIREKTLDTKVRVDGRKLNEIRKLSAEVSFLKRLHGSGLFERGDTQVLSIATLGSPGMAQLIEGPGGQEEKHYIHHYSFPPYSVGETGRIGSVSRREIGHGALAEKALEPVLPSQKEFPYTIRVVSEVFTSNGSTSMASTCGSTLALMDAGVPIKAPVAGMAMGIMTRSDDEYVVLTDIMGIEDFCGEMDFKVTGTTKGITAVQLDVKNMGLTDKMIDEILEGARVARLKALDVMLAALPESRKEVSTFAPKVMTLSVPTEKIGEVIGPGGKTIRGLSAQTETEINIEEDGTVTITGIDIAKVKEAAEIIDTMTREIEVGEEFSGPVKRILPFGAFVEILPGNEGLVHVSKMGAGFVKNPADVVQIDQIVRVRVYQIDNQGRINLEIIAEPVKDSHNRHQEKRHDERSDEE
jgi:polyribonucleotide nucleotidyltransferase